MATRGPWSVKGIEAKAREAALSAARNEGITLGDYLNRLLLEAEAEDAEMSLPNRQNDSPEAPANANLEALEKLTRRIEAVEARSTLAITGIDQSVVGLLSRLENTDAARAGLEGRIEQAVDSLRQTKHALEQRIDRMEADDTSHQNLRSLKMLETALERLANNVADQKANTDKAHESVVRAETRMSDLSEQVDSKLSDMSGHVERTLESAANSVSKAVEQAELRAEGTAKHLSERMSKLEVELFEEKRAHDDRFKKIETRVGGTLSSITDQIDRLSNGMSDTLKQSQEALTQAKKQNASIENITERLNRAETTTDAAMRELEHHFNRLDSRLEEFDQDLEGGRLSDLKTMVEDRMKAASSELVDTIQDIRTELADQLEAASAAPNAAFAEINTVVSEMHKRMQRAEKRQNEAIETIGEEFAKLTASLDRRVRQIEQRNDSELGSAVREQIENLAGNFHKRISELELREPGDNESLVAVGERMNELADALDKRVNASEERSAAAIRDFTEHVTTLTKNLSAKQDQGLKDISSQIKASEDRQVKRMDEALLGVRERIAQVEQATQSAVSPIQKAMAGFVERLQAVEDFSAPPGSRSAPKDDFELPSFEAELKKASAEPASIITPPAAPEPTPAAKKTADLPDMSGWDSLDDLADTPTSFPDIPEPKAAASKPAALDDDPWAADEDMFSSPPTDGFDDEFGTTDEFTADLPPLEKEFDLDAADADLDEYEEEFGAPPPGPNDYLARARAAANAGLENGRSTKHSPKKQKSGKGGTKIPLVAAASVLALTAAGTVGYLTIRGKQDQQKDSIIAVPSDLTPKETLDDTPPSVDPEAKAPSDEIDATGDIADDATDTPAAKDPSSPTPEVKADPETLHPAKAETTDIKAQQKPIQIARIENPVAKPVQPAATPKPTPTPVASKTPAPAPTPAPVEETPTLSVSAQQYQLGMAALNEGRIAEAASLISKAAEAGEPIAQYNLSKLYERGQGVPRDLVQSREWAQKAAEAGNITAMHDLAVFYAEGEGGAQSYQGAIQWFRQAADHGLIDSQYNLGILYEQGLGVTENKVEALYWFRVAQKLGDTSAAKKVMQLAGEVSEDDAKKTALLAGRFQTKPSDPIANGRFPTAGNVSVDADDAETVSSSMVRDAQILLNKLGYNAGTADGQAGTQTSEAILLFQSANRLPQSGAVTPTLLRQLQAAAAKS